MNPRALDKMLKYLPYPIAAILNRVGTSEGLKPGKDRLEFILATSKAVTKFLGALCLCECREQLETTPSAPPALCRDFGRAFKAPSASSWIAFGREGYRWLLEQRADCIAPEAAAFFHPAAGATDAKNLATSLTAVLNDADPLLAQELRALFAASELAQPAAALEALHALRNQLKHGKLKPVNANDFETLCGLAGELLDAVAQGLTFLETYQLTYNSKIQVQRKRRVTPKFRHIYKAYRGDRQLELVRARDLTMENEFQDSHSVLLHHKDAKDGARRLNLDPLLRYEESAGAAQDLFYYSGAFKKGKMLFLACHHGGMFASDDAQLMAEVRRFETLLQPLDAAQTRALSA